MGKIACAALVVFSLLMTGSPALSQQVDRVVISIEQAELIIGAYDRVRYAVSVEAVDAQGQRVSVATFLGVTVVSAGEIFWLSGEPWADFAVESGFASVQGVSDGMLEDYDARFVVFGFAGGVFDLAEVPLFP